MNPHHLLKDHAHQYNVELVVLADTHGFVLAAGGVQKHAEGLAGAGALAWQLMQKMQRHAGMVAAEEFSIVTTRHQKLVCRTFETKQHRFLLLMLLPSSTAYRRRTSQLIRQLQTVLD